MARVLSYNDHAEILEFRRHDTARSILREPIENVAITHGCTVQTAPFMRAPDQIQRVASRVTKLQRRLSGRTHSTVSSHRCRLAPTSPHYAHYKVAQCHPGAEYLFIAGKSLLGRPVSGKPQNKCCQQVMDDVRLWTQVQRSGLSNVQSRVLLLQYLTQNVWTEGQGGG